MRLYFDGAEIAGSPFDASPNHTLQNLHSVRFATGPGGTGTTLQGEIELDEFRLYGNQVLTAAEVSTNFAAGPVTIPQVGEFTWYHDDLGDWHSLQSWAPASVPNGNDLKAVFGSAITSPRTVVVDQPVTIGSIQFSNETTYNIAGNSSVTLAEGSGQEIP